MIITRRGFVVRSAAAALLPFSPARAATALPRDAEIVIVGAGAAGIAAARRIVAANRKVLIVEAADRIGGRCITDTTLGVPFDRGARWLYAPDANPLTRLVRQAGGELYPTAPGQKIRVGRRNSRAGETEDFLATLVRANRALDEASRGRIDIACAAAMPKDLGDWHGTVDFILGPYATGKDLKDLSVVDRQRMQDRSSALATRQGLGSMLAKLAEGLPISLATPATRIVWGGREASVETPAGRIAARAVIVTVSTNVLTSSALKFAPGLPKRQLDAVSKLGLGSNDRIALLFAGNPLGLSRDDLVIEQSADARTALLCANINGSSLCTVDVGGAFGRDLSAQGEGAMVEFATQWLTKLFGSDLAKATQKSAATRWNAAPLVQGASSAAAAGGAGSRKILTETFGNVYLAGEAAHETLYGGVEGAWQSGERAADAALRQIGALREETPAPVQRPQRQRRRVPEEVTGIIRAE